MTYTINTNPTFNSLEISFEHKPGEKVIKALKDLKFRWHHQKALWYGYSTEHALISAIQNAEQEENPLQTGVILSDGYMGATRVDGINSNKRLYGKDLTEAIRNHIKQVGIKGVTVSRKSYSGGQTLTLKIKFDPETDLIPLDDYCTQYEVNPGTWYYYNDGDKYALSMFGDKWFDLDGEERETMRRKFAEFRYEKIRKGVPVSEYHLTADRYPEYTPEFFKKITQINAIVASYRYDDSNGQVDYFETNFYYDLVTVPATK